jgi:hypothetical protein
LRVVIVACLAVLCSALLVVTGPAVRNVFSIADGTYSVDDVIFAVVFLEPYPLWCLLLAALLIWREKIWVWQYFLVFSVAWVAWFFIGFATPSAVEEILQQRSQSPSWGLFGAVFFLLIPWYAAQFLALAVLVTLLLGVKRADSAASDGTSVDARQ